MTIDRAPGWTHRHLLEVPADPGRVFAALTDAAELGAWFTEDVDVQPHVGGRYHFWGKHSYQVPTLREATQLITAYAPAERLGFTWRIDGGESDVLITLTPVRDGITRVEAAHSFAMQQDHEVIEDLWRMIAANLHAHLGGGGVFRPDFGSASHAIRWAVDVPVPPSQLYAFLLDPVAVGRWIGPARVVIEPRVGGRYEYGWEYTVEDRTVIGGPSRILAMEHDRRLVVDWGDWRGHTDRVPTALEWLLEPAQGCTRVTLTHGGFARAVDVSDYGPGWWAILQQLQREFM